MITVHAPAKLNLVLEVLGREGRYHRISSVLQTVSLYDTLTIEPAGDIHFTCSEPALQSDNLVQRAAETLKKSFNVREGAAIHLQKLIPWAAGLGGGSSDAAAALRALNVLWNLGLSDEELCACARTLGSDVPALVPGGTVRMTGTGDIVGRLPDLAPTHFVVLVPDVPVPLNKTANLYSRITAEMYTDGHHTAAAIESLNRHGVIPSGLHFNVFDTVAKRSFQGIEIALAGLAALSHTEVHLAGSGPALFAMAGSSVEASRIAGELTAAGQKVFAVESVTGADT